MSEPMAAVIGCPVDNFGTPQLEAAAAGAAVLEPDEELEDVLDESLEPDDEVDGELSSLLAELDEPAVLLDFDESRLSLR